MQNMIGVRLDDDLWKVVAELAESEHRTPAAMMRKLALEALAARGVWPRAKADELEKKAAD